MQLRPCAQCRRHVDLTETACPFCHAALEPVAPRSVHVAGRLSRAAVFAGATLTSAALTGACWTGSAPPTTTPVDDTQTQGPVEANPAAIPAGTIRGVVRNHATAAPVIGVRVMLRADATGALMQGLTDEHGEYVFSGLAPGSYTITNQPNHPRQAPVQISVELPADTGARGDFAIAVPAPNHSNIPMPYGAPPARRRVV